MLPAKALILPLKPRISLCVTVALQLAITCKNITCNRVFRRELRSLLNQLLYQITNQLLYYITNISYVIVTPFHNITSTSRLL